MVHNVHVSGLLVFDDFSPAMRPNSLKEEVLHACLSSSGSCWHLACTITSPPDVILFADGERLWGRSDE